MRCEWEGKGTMYKKFRYSRGSGVCWFIGACEVQGEDVAVLVIRYDRCMLGLRFQIGFAFLRFREGVRRFCL